MEKLLEKIFSKIKKTPSTRCYEDLYFMCKETINENLVLLGDSYRFKKQYLTEMKLLKVNSLQSLSSLMGGFL